MTSDVAFLLGLAAGFMLCGGAVVAGLMLKVWLERGDGGEQLERTSRPVGETSLPLSFRVIDPDEQDDHWTPLDVAVQIGHHQLNNPRGKP